MTRVQKAQLRQSELKTEIAAELDKENEQREEGRLERLTREAQAVEVELRADLTIEAEAAIPDCIDTPEGRDLREFRRRSSIFDYVSEVMDGRTLDGASLEYRQALMGDHLSHVPLEILLDDEELETCADAVSNSPRGPQRTPTTDVDAGHVAGSSGRAPINCFQVVKS